MSNENYSPDEIRLLDEFEADFWTRAYIDNGYEAEDADAAVRRLRERRKRVPVDTTVDLANLPKRKPAFAFMEPTPHPEQQPSGELTEGAIAAWVEEAQSVQHAEIDSINLVDDADVHRAVALMREGLAAKAEVTHLKRVNATLHENFDRNDGYRRTVWAALGFQDVVCSNVVAEAAKDLRTRAEQAVKERDTYKRLLDEGAQPVGHTAMKQANNLLTEGLALAVKERDEARAEVARLKTWFDAVMLNRQFNSTPTKPSTQASTLMGFTIDEACKILSNFDNATYHLRKRAEEAEAQLAAAQPVLDAGVDVADFKEHGNTRWCSDLYKALQAYADRRRNEERAKQQGGA